VRLIDYLDKGASLGPDRPCLTTAEDDVQHLSYRIGKALQRSGVRPGDKVAILSANDPVAFSCVFGISRAGAVWCPINPRNEAAENRELLDLFDCTALIYQKSFAPLVDQIRDRLAKLTVLVCLDTEFETWLDGISDEPWQAEPPDDVAMIAGTGGTTGRPKGVVLTGANLEAMTAIVLMSYPFQGRPVYLALAPLTHAAGVLCFPMLALGGRIVVLRKPDLGDFLDAVARYDVTHTFLPPTLIYLLLGKPELKSTKRSSLQCFWYGAAPMSTARLEQALGVIGPVMAQLYGQTEAPMMVSTMAPAEHFRADGTPATERFASAGRPAPLVTVAIMDPDGQLLARGERGEIVVRGSLVSPGYYKNPVATAEARRGLWHRTGDIGYLDNDNYLFIVDRAKDMIITGGFNVYSAEVEQTLLSHPSVRDCAVIGLPDDKWGERVVAVLEAGPDLDVDELRDYVRERIGGVKTPKQFEIWTDLPRSKVGKVLKTEVKQQLLSTVPLEHDS
jgi:acyl-CoA synthetase (AMP-forming)/AMP-acid ligase II